MMTTTSMIGRSVRSAALAASLAVLGLSAAVVVVPGCAKLDDRRLEEEKLVVSDVKSLFAKQRAEPKSTTAIFIDARRPSVTRQGMIPGAIMLDITQVDLINKRTNPAIEKFSTKVVYGDNPGDAIAKALAKKMIEAGYSDVRWFEDGWEGWVRSGGETK